MPYRFWVFVDWIMGALLITGIASFVGGAVWALLHAPAASVICLTGGAILVAFVSRYGRRVADIVDPAGRSDR